jgi:hypothetical protein
VKVVKTRLFVAASALVLASFPAPAPAQQMSMPGMQMPKSPKMTTKKTIQKGTPKKHATKKESAAKRKAAAAKKTIGHNAHRPTSKAALEHKTMSMPMPAQSQPATGAMPMSPSQMQSGTTAVTTQTPMQPEGAAGGMAMPMGQTTGGQTSMGQTSTGGMSMQKGAHGMKSSGALGSYPAQRESSGTAWQPDASNAMTGPMLMSGDWMLMAHGTLNLVYDRQSGPRGDSKAFASGMLMGMASHPLGHGTVQFRAMLSPDPLMGPPGYPLLLATGETANGRTPLIDRQHPHDLFMELSASVSQPIGPRSSVFLYGGLPGEPAFGPPAFMHRESILDSPEAPITHHWLDSTHISFGVLTAGLVVDRVKLEVSRFNGREPDQHRWDIETGPLDSTSVRVSWNPTRTLALQGSWGYFKDPEQLEPGVNQKRLSASALWADEIAPGWKAAATLAWGRKSSQGHNDDGVAAEGSLKHAQWTLFGRAEMVENRELLGLQEGSPAYRVGKVSLGAVRDFRIADHLSLGLGGLFSLNFVPNALAPLYGSPNPTGAMGFVRLKLN